MRGNGDDDIIDIYFEDAAAAEPPTLEEERELLARIAAGDDEASDELIERNVRLVISIAAKYRGRGVPFADLIQEGNMGLMRAIERFDLGRGCKLSTYATFWITQACQRAISDMSNTIRVPVHRFDAVRKMAAVRDRLSARNGSTTRAQIAEEMDVDEEHVEMLCGVMRLSDVLSLDRPVREDEKDSSVMADFVADDNLPGIEDSVDTAMLAEKLDDIMRVLTPREEKIIRLRFGLDDGISRTLEEVAAKFDLTRERIRQIEQSALRRMRHPRCSRRLVPWID